jgi:prepilin-type N-terminal cleavage/methylation domain-containing protein
MRRRAHGFTLLEVLIGLVVLSLALLALTRTAALQVDALGQLRDRTMAGWLAQICSPRRTSAIRFRRWHEQRHAPVRSGRVALGNERAADSGRNNPANRRARLR